MVGEGPQDTVEASQLLGGEGIVGLVRHGAVGEHRRQLQERLGGDGVGEGRSGIGIGAHAVHARVDLEVHAHRVPVARRRPRRSGDPLRAVQGGFEAVRRDLGHVRGPGLRQDQHGVGEAGVPQLDALLGDGDAEGDRAGVERRRGDGHGAVAVAARLHDGEQLGRCRLGPEDADVVGDGAEVDLGPRPRLAHGRAPGPVGGRPCRTSGTPAPVRGEQSVCT